MSGDCPVQVIEKDGGTRPIEERDLSWSVLPWADKLAVLAWRVERAAKS